MHGCPPRRRGRGAAPRFLAFPRTVASRAQAPHFLVEPIVQWHTFASAGRYRRRPRGQFRGKMPRVFEGRCPGFQGKMPELMSMRPRAFRLPGDSIDRARFSAGRAGPFLKEMVGELSRCRRTHLIQINALTLIKINALMAVTY